MILPRDGRRDRVDVVENHHRDEEAGGDRDHRRHLGCLPFVVAKVDK